MRKIVYPAIFFIVVISLTTIGSVLLYNEIQPKMNIGKEIQKINEDSIAEPLWTLPNGTKVYRNIDWLNNNVCYTTVWNLTSDMAISCVSMVK